MLQPQTRLFPLIGALDTRLCLKIGIFQVAQTQLTTQFNFFYAISKKLALSHQSIELS